MIDIKTTIKEKGYNPNDLSKGSHKRIWAICDDCEKGRWVNFQAYKPLCKSCSTKRLKQGILKEKNNFDFGKYHNNEREITLKEKGYDMDYLKLKSRRKVWSICEKCHKSRWVVFGQYRKLCSSCVRKGKNYSSKILKCDECNKQIKVMFCHIKMNKKHFCDAKCFGKYQSKNNCGKNNPNWQDNSVNEYCSKFNNNCKESNRNKYNNRCFLCGKLEKDNITKKGKMKKLHVHHIDYDKEQGCNNKKWLLVPLCNSCHAKTSGKYLRDYYQKIILNLLYIRKMILEYENKIDYKSIR